MNETTDFSGLMKKDTPLEERETIVLVPKATTLTESMRDDHKSAVGMKENEHLKPLDTPPGPGATGACRKR